MRIRNRVLMGCATVAVGVAATWITACSGSTGENGSPGGAAGAAKVLLTSEPATIKAGEPTKLTFTVKDGSGAVVRKLAVVHEKTLHLLVVSKDLADFSHIHPEANADGSLSVTHTFASGGSYLLYADYKPEGGKATVDTIPVTVDGPQRAPVALVADTTLVKSVEGLTVTMRPDGALKPGSPATIYFDVKDAASGKPVTNLEKYLGEYAHFVLISQDGSEFLHAHPMSGDMGGKGDSHSGGMDHGAMNHGGTHGKTKDTAASPSQVMAHTEFPKAGLYKVWAQFQRAGKVITVPFVVQIGA